MRSTTTERLAACKAARLVGVARRIQGVPPQRPVSADDAPVDARFNASVLALALQIREFRRELARVNDVVSLLSCRA